MDKSLTPEQRLVYQMLFTPGTSTYELPLDDWAETEEQEMFIEYILDVLLAGRMKVVTDEMTMDFKRGQVWRLKVKPIAHKPAMSVIEKPRKKKELTE